MDDLASFILLGQDSNQVNTTPNAAIKEFPLSFEPSQVHFVASNLYQHISGLFPSQEIDTVNTFGKPPLTPQVLSVFTVISDETQKYFAIHTCIGYYRVGHSPPLLYYKLLAI